MEYKDRLLNEYRDLIIKRIKLETSEYFNKDELMQKQGEAMFRYEEILAQRILNIMHASDTLLKHPMENAIRESMLSM